MSRSTGIRGREVSGNAENCFREGSAGSGLDLFKSGAMSDVGSRMPGLQKECRPERKYWHGSGVYRVLTVAESS